MHEQWGGAEREGKTDSLLKREGYAGGDGGLYLTTHEIMT